MFFYSQKQAFLLWAFLLGSALLCLTLPSLVLADSIYQAETFRASATSEFNTGIINASLYSSLSLQFNFDATTLDFGPPQDSFTYGYRYGGAEYPLGTHLGLAGSTTAETGFIDIDLPQTAEVSNLEVFLSVVANSTASSDKVELRNILLAGQPRPIIIDVCTNIVGNQATLPSGYEVNADGDCTLIPPPPVDVCTNLAGLQETLPAGYEKNVDNDCVLIPPPPTDICTNLAGLQTVLPTSYEINVDGDCVVIPPPPTDICTNLAGLQTTLPQGYEINVDGDCALIPPPSVDACTNLAGLQETLPIGYEKDLAGDCVVIPSLPIDVCSNLPGVQIEIPSDFIINSEGNCVLAPVLPIDLCPNIDGVQVSLPSGQQLDAGGQCVTIVVNPPPAPTPIIKQCPKGFSKWIDRFTAKHIWRADDVYQGIILIGGPTNRKSNKDKAHFLYIAGPTEVGDKYYRRFHKIIQVCVRG